MKWRVYNMHPEGLTHREKFRDEMIEIKANSYVLMDYEDAVLFKSQYFPMKMNAMNVQDSTTYKVIKIEAEGQVEEKKTELRYVCHVDGKEFSSKAELEAYVNAKYADLEPFRDDSIEEQIKQEAAIETAKRKPGRPPREKTL